MLTRPSDVQLFRQVLTELEARAPADDPLLWSMRYRVALKMMHASDATSAESRAARDELRGVLAWQVAHLSPRDTQPYNTKFALAAELMDEVRTPEALQEAEELLQSCVAFNQRRRDMFDTVTCQTRLMTAVFDLGRREEALKLGRETCGLAMEKQGEYQAITGRAFARLALLCRGAGLIEEAITHSRHAVDIFWHTVGPANVKANAALEELAEMLEKKGDLHGLLQLRRASLRECDQQIGTMSSDTQWEAGKVVEVLRELHQVDEAHALAEMWLDRVRVEGRLPPGAALLLLGEFLNLQSLARHEQAEKLLQQLPGLLQAQSWTQSAYEPLMRWETVAVGLKNAERYSECVSIVRSIMQVMDEGTILGRKAMGLRPEFQKLLEEAQAQQKAGSDAGKKLGQEATARPPR